jgi:hypothetical protein
MAVYCNHCGDEIKYQSDLIVTSNLFTFSTYHAECYGLVIKRSGGFFIGQPINSPQGTFAPIAVFSIYLFSLLTTNLRTEPVMHFLFALLILASAFPRLYSYYKFEKKL